MQMQADTHLNDAVTDVAEQHTMLEIQRTYGKTIHTWPTDVHPDLPLGLPQLTVLYTADGQGSPRK